MCFRRLAATRWIRSRQPRDGVPWTGPKGTSRLSSLFLPRYRSEIGSLSPSRRGWHQYPIQHRTQLCVEALQALLVAQEFSHLQAVAKEDTFPALVPHTTRTQRCFRASAHYDSTPVLSGRHQQHVLQELSMTPLAQFVETSSYPTNINVGSWLK